MKPFSGFSKPKKTKNLMGLSFTTQFKTSLHYHLPVKVVGDMPVIYKYKPQQICASLIYKRNL